MNNVLIVTYYFPPSGGPGVQRVLKFAKYLPEFGWEPTVLTVEGGEYPDYDDSLLEEIPRSTNVVRARTIEPYTLYRLFTGKRSKEKIPVGVLSMHEHASLRERLANQVRANLFIPDARIGWIPFAVRAGKKAIRDRRASIIFTTSPPHSAALVGARLRKAAGLPFVADLRDPWLEIDYYQGFRRTKLATAIDARLERKALSRADAIITISPSLGDLIRSKRYNRNVHVITNGYDEDDFRGIPRQEVSRFTIAHVGNAGAQRNPRMLFSVLSALAARESEFRKDLKLQFVGNVDRSIHEELRALGLEELSEFVPYVPHRRALEFMVNASILLLVINQNEQNRGILTGKLFDYIGARRPVLAVGPVGGDADRILRESGAGVLVDHDERTRTEDVVQDFYRRWKSGSLTVETRDGEQYSRRAQAKHLSILFDSLIAGTRHA